MSDATTPVSDLRDLVRRFVKARDWNQFHSPKNVAMALAVEAAELMEHFQWMSVEASRSVVHDAVRLEAIGEELADVVCYAVAMANELDLDISSIVRRKMAKNERKYPSDMFQGRYQIEDAQPNRRHDEDS